MQGNAHIEFEDQSPDFIAQLLVGLQELDFGSDKLTAKKVVRSGCEWPLSLRVMQ